MTSKTSHGCLDVVPIIKTIYWVDNVVFLHGSLPGCDVRVGVEPKGGHQREPCDYIGKCEPPLHLCLDGL